ncbi:MAG: N-acetyltransferase [Sulfurospirillaceae bacterium]|nr:N-acetyltransferase [Sulfurospirillaceae bacterium]MDD2827329.1 N-acetyltransferase [Sulfurospirillaceae bacterium]
MTIELASKEDVVYLCQLENESFGVNDFRLSAENFLYHINKEHVLIIKMNHIIAGYLLFFTYKQGLRVYSLATQKSLRGKQIAQHLLLHVKKLADTLNKSYITLEVREDNEIAINLYQKMGFVKVKYLHNYYLNGIDGIKMKWKKNGAVGGI